MKVETSGRKLKIKSVKGERRHLSSLRNMDEIQIIQQSIGKKSQKKFG